MFEGGEGNLTPINSIGEFQLIERIAANFLPEHGNVLKGIGDDAAVIDLGDGRVQLTSTDCLIEGVHFDLAYVPLQHLGYKSVVVNLSDIYAMNGTPEGVTISIAMSNRFTVEAMDAFYAGVKYACDTYGIQLLGGDLSSSDKGLMISVTAVGFGKKDEVTYRNGAEESELICVTGDIGAAYAGLQILEREKQVFISNPEMQPDLSGFDYVVKRQLKPEARKDIIEEFQKKGIKPTSMIDISDGLASEILHLCKASGLGATVYEEKIPIDHQVVNVAEELSIHPLTMALNGGEDYELLFTVKLEDFVLVDQVPEIFVIGHMSEKDAGAKLVTRNNSVMEITAQGWKHFSE